MKVRENTNELLAAELEVADARRNRAEEEMWESEKFSSSLLENLPGAILVANPDASIRYVNPALENLTGFSSAEVVGKKTPYPWWIWGKSPENSGNYIANITGRTRGFEFYRKKSGEVFWAEVTTVPVRYDADIQYYISSWLDVTEHKRAEKQIIEANTFYKNILDGIINGVLVTDKRDIICYSNKSMADITGIPPAKMFGKSILADFIENNVGFIPSHYFKAKKTLKPQYFDAIPTATDGRKTYQSGWLVPLVQNDVFNGMIGTVEDVTERVRTEEELTRYEEMNRLKGELLAKVSHQLRTPLATIKGYSTMLLEYEKRLSVKEKHGYLEAIDSVTGTLTKLVGQLLDISRLEAGILKLHKKSVNVTGLLEEVTAEAKRRPTAHEIINNSEAWLPRVRIDVDWIKQVMENLIDNACKFSREGTEVVISARRDGQNLLFSVADQGIGIPDEELLKVFDHMYRIEQAQSKATPGLGLGLAISKEIVVAHGGHIWAESRVGTGSTFYFSLPVQNHVHTRK
jgi:PAS domain S-box-containing protein